MKLQSLCPVTLPLLQSFLSKANHSCPGDLSACLDFVEHTAVHDSLFKMDLSGEWSFYMGAMENASFSGETVTLPGTMDENGKGYDNRNCLSIRHLNRDYVYTGPATYQRTFTLPSSWSNRRIVLELERTKKTRVLLDGVSVGPRQMSYSTPHRYEITPFAARVQHTPLPSRWIILRLTCRMRCRKRPRPYRRSVDDTSGKQNFHWVKNHSYTTFIISRTPFLSWHRPLPNTIDILAMDN